jgi:transcriptional regulator with XRE-family HTH domain
MREHLIRIQRREGLKDREMAEKLGVARSTWTSIKLGSLELSEAITMRAARAFPELLPGLVMSLSQSEADDVDQVAQVTPPAAEKVAS